MSRRAKRLTKSPTEEVPKPQIKSVRVLKGGKEIDTTKYEKEIFIEVKTKDASGCRLTVTAKNTDWKEPEMTLERKWAVSSNGILVTEEDGVPIPAPVLKKVEGVLIPFTPQAEWLKDDIKELSGKTVFEVSLPSSIRYSFYMDWKGDRRDVDNMESKEIEIERDICFCDRNITSEELRKIVKNIRDNTSSGGKTITFYHREKLFYLYAKVPQTDQTFEKFAEVLNCAFKKHGITKCSHKIHFLANMYVETMYFTATKEGGSNLRYDPYRGRGFQHLTWKENYKKYEKETGIKIVTDYEKVANDLNIAADTGAWYWMKMNINEFAEKDSIFDTSRLINLPSAKKTSQINGYKDREIAWLELKKIFKYPEECTNVNSALK